MVTEGWGGAGDEAVGEVRGGGQDRVECAFHPWCGGWGLKLGFGVEGLGMRF